MKTFIIRVLNKIVWILSKSGKKGAVDAGTAQAIQAGRVVQWFKDEGDKTHRFNYDLDASSLVFDLGGYEGQWASDIYSMYNPSIRIFEPYVPFANGIEKRFEKNKKIQVFAFGLGARNETVKLSVLDNASSVFQAGHNKASISIVSVVDFLKQQRVESVDLIKINIEGAEYELLETLLDNDLIKIFKNIQVQFHDFIIENAKERMNRIQERLAITHELTYQYEFVWENWRIR